MSRQNYSAIIMNERTWWGASLGFGLSWLPALLGHQIVARVSGLYRLGAEPHPYFQPFDGWLLYFLTPLVIVSSFSLFLSPGALLAIALDQAENAAEWIVFAFGHSLVLWILLSSGAKLLLGSPVTSALLLSLWLGATAVVWLLLVLRVKTRRGLRWPITQRSDARRIAWLVGASVLGIVALIPKLFWENFNVDGVEAFEFGRSLTTQILPNWEIQDGVFGLYHNFLLFAYPNYWFINLFGPFEAAARLPFLLYLIVLFAALILLIEWARPRQLSAGEEAMIWLGLSVYVVVHTYNTNYDSFFADLAEMAATDTLWVTCFLSACYALWTNRTGWFWLFALMTYTASPGGLLLLAALVPATFFSGSAARMEQLRTVVSVIAVCLVVGVAYELFYSGLVMGQVNNQFSAKNMLRRLYPPTFTEFVRFNALVFPSGILPALSLLAVRRKDHAAWVIGGVTVIYFGAIYLQAWTSLHQFTPVMILPLVVFWRVYLDFSPAVQKWLLPSVALTTIASLYLSLPRHFQINLAIREFGQATLYKIGDYERSYERALRGGASLAALIPIGYRLQYPDQPWGSDPASWIYYATREKPPGTTINYVVQPSSEPAPGGLNPVSTENGVSVYVRDQEIWRRHRERELPRVVQSPLYEPMYRRTFQFFRDFAEMVQKKEKARGSSGEK